MGMFDTVWIKCPMCDERIECQSKAGDCTLHDYYGLDDVPSEILKDLKDDSLNGDIVCNKCDIEFIIELVPVEALKATLMMKKR